MTFQVDMMVYEEFVSLETVLHFRDHTHFLSNE